MTIRVSSREPVRAKLVDEPQPGFDVERAGLAATLARADAGVRIAASRFGERLTVDRLDSLRGECESAGGWTVAFGAPERGLPDVLGEDAEAIAAASREGTPSETGTVAVAGHTDTDDDGAPAGEAGGATANEPRDPRFDLWLNTVPDQGSETVRTEEAMFATLSPLRLPRR